MGSVDPFGVHPLRSTVEHDDRSVRASPHRQAEQRLNADESLAEGTPLTTTATIATTGVETDTTNNQASATWRGVLPIAFAALLSLADWIGRNPPSGK